MPYVRAGEARVHYEVDGAGPGLVLVHGMGGDAERVFGEVVGLVADDRTVIRPNLSGSGSTTDDGGELTVEVLADQVAAAARAVVDEPVDLLGFSLGAVVAAAVAAQDPSLVRSLVLVAGWTHSSGPRDRFYFETAHRLLAADRELFKRFTTLTGWSPAGVDRFGHEGLAGFLADDWPPSGIARQVDLARRVDIRPLLPRITAPTLVIGLRDDAMVPVEGSRRLSAGIPGARLVELDGEGHMDWMSDPRRIVDLTREFIASPVPAGAPTQ